MIFCTPAPGNHHCSEQPHGYPLEVISELIEQLCLFDTSVQTGYMGMGVNNAILEGTILRLEEGRKI